MAIFDAHGCRLEVCDPCGALHVRPGGAIAGVCHHGVTRVLTDEEVVAIEEAFDGAASRLMQAEIDANEREAELHNEPGPWDLPF